MRTFLNANISKLSVAALVAGFFVAGCGTNDLRPDAQTVNGTSPKVGSDYNKLIEYFSGGDTEFNGLNNNFEFRATLENSVVREASLEHQAHYYEWDQARVTVEREKIQKEERDATKVFLSFFTPSHENDNLTNTKSIWKIYLDAGNQRYEGKIKRLRTLLAELQSLYAYHTRWATSYEVEFPIGTAVIETVPTKLTITGPLGTRSVVIPSVRN